MKFRKILAVVAALALCITAMGTTKTMAVDGTVLLTGNGAIDMAALKAAPEGSKLVAEYLWAEGASAENYWGIGGVCFDGGWTVDSAFEVTIPGEASRGDTLTAEFAVADVLAKAGDGACNWNFYNGIETYTLYLVAGAEAPAAEEPAAEEPAADEPAAEEPAAEEPAAEAPAEVIAPAPLPQTGVVSAAVLYAAGACLVAGGIKLVKKNED